MNNIFAKIIESVDEFDFKQLKENFPVSEENQDFDLELTRLFVEDKKNILILGFVDNEIAGMLFGQEINAFEINKKEFFINEVGVCPKFFRMGVGTKMFEVLNQELKSRNFSEAFVFTDPDNIASNALYTKAGGKKSDPQVMFAIEY